MFNRESVEIKQMTAKQEEILSNLGYLEDGSMIERLISSILIDTSVNAAELMPADQNAIIIAASCFNMSTTTIIETNTTSKTM